MSAMASRSSMGWDEDEKQKELFHTDSRFIVLSAVPAESDPPQPEEQEPEHVVGFSMFRFDYEEGEKLLYCYEVQLDTSSRRLGLGKFLMDELIHIGSTWNMEKVMLTVLKANSDAVRFYREIGFTLDPSSPDYVGENEEHDPEDAECDYEIMSVVL
ncbi:GNAT family N-acetyltransferase [Phanerochaete sordida]|uniref:N-alpha-acetyltransferase 40 n=1 Tax=Phanerochaete sordida TaxID=48140 RepID=A0A9P3LB35_9APHY|nr:GNAT family N-acetyltransferase [Phanerochaete sordida]